MTIYATPYNPTTKEATGPSTDSGFESLDQVVCMIGVPTHRSPRWLSYITGDDQAVAYSTFPFRLEGVVDAG